MDAVESTLSHYIVYFSNDNVRACNPDIWMRVGVGSDKRDIIDSVPFILHASSLTNAELNLELAVDRLLTLHDSNYAWTDRGTVRDFLDVAEMSVAGYNRLRSTIPHYVTQRMGTGQLAGISKMEYRADKVVKPRKRGRVICLN